MNISVVPLILMGVVLNATAQLFLKMGVTKMEQLLSWSGVTEAITSPYIISGLICYVMSVCVWLLVLSKADVSYAYPMVSLGYILTAFFGYYVLDEALSISRMVGIMLILGGVYFVARS